MPTVPDAAAPAARRVLIAFDPARWKFRGALRGINRFAVTTARWELMLVRYHRWLSPMSPAVAEVGGAIVDAAAESRELVDALACPAVSLSDHPQFRDRPTVRHDYATIAAAAVAVFTGRGFRRLGLFTTGEGYRLDAQSTGAEVRRQAAAAGLGVETFDRGPRTLARGRWVLDDQVADLAEWLAGQPKPFGLLAVDDEHAWRAIEAAALAGLAVPADVAVLGIGDDDCLCESARPTISSVMLDYERAGFEAARLLHALINGTPRPRVAPVPPLGVAERGSTDALAIPDPLVAQAVTLIRGEEGYRLTIDELAARVHTSRRTLYRRFNEALQRTPGEEIRLARLEAARRLITATDLKLAAIAARVGFPSISQLSRDIEREYGRRPTALRQAGHGASR